MVEFVGLGFLYIVLERKKPQNMLVNKKPAIQIFGEFPSVAHIYMYYFYRNRISY